MKVSRRRSLFVTSFGLLFLLSTVVTATPAGATTPNAPSGVTATYLSSSQAVVSWSAPTPVSGVTITGYVVTSSPGGLTCALSASASTLSCLELGLTAGTSYTFSVVAWSAGGTGPSASSTASTSPSISTTTTTLNASPLSPQNPGTVVTLTATVPVGATGTVNFESGGTTITGCGSEVVTSGFATCTTKSLATATDSLTAVYSGDSNYQTSTSSVLSYTISSSTLAVPTSPVVITSTSALFNTALTLTTSGGSGGGAITFSVVNGTATSACTLSGSSLSLATTNTSGTCLVTATQASAGGYLAQTSNVTTVNFYWNYATYPYDYPYCNSGDTLSGDTCQHYVGTYPAEPIGYSYWCSSGWSGPSGTTCYRYADISHAACTADGGTWLGSECELYTAANVTDEYGSGSCNPGDVLSGSTCYQYSYYTAYEGLAYSCPYGGTLGGPSGLTCSLSGGSGPNLRSALRSASASGASPPAPTNVSPSSETSQQVGSK